MTKKASRKNTRKVVSKKKSQKKMSSSYRSVLKKTPIKNKRSVLKKRTNSTKKRVIIMKKPTHTKPINKLLKSPRKVTKKSPKKVLKKTAKKESITKAPSRGSASKKRKSPIGSTPNRKRVSKKKKIQAHTSSTRTTRRTRSPRKALKSFIRIKVVGVGGGGGNAITRMRSSFSVRGVEFIAINTDIQDLAVSDAHKRLNIGRALTKGMGAGMNPDLGQQAAEENRSEIAEAIRDADMIFLTAGFGGGTGTGATPVIADVARELGILTVAIVTKPFGFEGSVRTKIAEDGLMNIKDRVDTLLVIPNDRIFSIIDKNTSVSRAFEKIDEVLQSSVQGVAEVIASSGLVNVDFADIKAIMAGSGDAVVGVGTASGADRAVKAVNQAIHSPLLDVSIDGARSVLFGIAGGRDMRMAEINDAAKIITEVIDQGAKIIFGAYYDRRLKSGELKITLIATGFNGMTMRNDLDSLSLFNKRLNSESKQKDRVEDVQLVDDPIEDIGDSSTSEEKDIKSEEEIWDIPTFLRKKGRRK